MKTKITIVFGDDTEGFAGMTREFEVDEFDLDLKQDHNPVYSLQDGRVKGVELGDRIITIKALQRMTPKIVPIPTE